jgi:nucleotide-binding universal stress UspA family protein
MVSSSNTNADNESNVTINARDTTPSHTASSDLSISKSNIPSITKILVAHDGKDSSNKAVNYAISLSNLSGAELVLLRIIQDVDKMEDTSVKVGDSSGDTSLSRNVQGPVVDAMENTIKKCKEAGCKNKISYKFRMGDDLVPEIVDEIKSEGYDMVVLTSSHIDSWVRSLFSDARKIISNITTPVLLVQ